MIYLYGILFSQIIALFGIRLGYHRYLSHNEFKAGPLYETVVILLGIFSGARSPLTWVGIHRMHHEHSDTEKDPHSPKHKGFFTVLFSTWKVDSISRKYIRDVIKNPRVKFFHNYWKHIWFSSAVILILIDITAFIAFWIIPFIINQIAFGVLNTFGHKDGKPSHSYFAHLLTAGEGNHKLHHERNI